MNWNQSICLGCYLKRHPGRLPNQVLDAAPETCCDCGCLTQLGIYYRVDSRTVKFPTDTLTNR